MPRADKTAAVADLVEALRTSAATVLTDYRGLTVAQMSALRVALGPETRYAVVKNTLTRIAAGQVGLDGLGELLVGPTAVAFVRGDPVAAARGLRDFARANPPLVVKGALVEGRLLGAEQLRQLAELQSREVLLARLAAAMTAGPARAAGTFAAALARPARLAVALAATGRDGAPSEPAPTPEGDVRVEDAPPPAAAAPTHPAADVAGAPEGAHPEAGAAPPPAGP